MHTHNPDLSVSITAEGRKQLQSLLLAGAERINDTDYMAWYNSTSCRSFEEWRTDYSTDYSRELEEELRAQAELLEHDIE